MFDDIKIRLLDAINEKTVTYFKHNRENNNYNLDEIVQSALNIINTSDATYHDAEHTCLVTMCGLDIMAGKSTLEGNLDYSINWFTAGYFNTTSTINAIKFQMSSGNIDSGTIKMYGVK